MQLIVFSCDLPNQNSDQISEYSREFTEDLEEPNEGRKGIHEKDEDRESIQKVKEMIENAVKQGKLDADHFKEGSTPRTVICIPSKTEILLGTGNNYFSNLNAHIKRKNLRNPHPGTDRVNRR